MIKVDGRIYDVEVTEIGLSVEFMYKYAERTESFELKYELGAVYFNQSMTFGTECTDNEDFTDLFKLLSTKSTIDQGTGHNVEIWTPLGKMTFLMYPNGIEVKMLMLEQHEKTWWAGMNVKFIAVKPVESW